MSIVKIAAKNKKKDPWQNAKKGAMYGAAIGSIGIPAASLSSALLQHGASIRDLKNPVSSVLRPMAYGASAGAILGGTGSILKDKLSDEVEKSG
jgi:hypothetical protein